jgi:hypothetical protein
MDAAPTAYALWQRAMQHCSGDFTGTIRLSAMPIELDGHIEKPTE